MADAPKQEGVPPGAQYQPPKPPPKQNPVFRMMGLPNFRFRLPSRNWLIFLSMTGSWTAAVVYDRRQKKAVQKKWCDMVADIAQQTMPVNQMPRKLTVFLSAPPGDGIGHSRQYFKDYVKPILVAAAMDYDVIEGRKEGDVRYGTAEQIRRIRRKRGEIGAAPIDDEPDTEQAIEMIREKMHVVPEPGLRGDLVLGRHTWKEYIRGIHEGWLGPLDEPAEPIAESDISTMPPLEVTTDAPQTTAPEAELEIKNGGEDKKEDEAKEEKKKPFPPASYLPTAAYSSSPLSPHTPSIFDPSQPIYQQHILGFLKTPIRIYNFLNRRSLADDIGRQTAAIVLAAHRPYNSDESFASSTDDGNFDSGNLATRAPENDVDTVQTKETWEQQSPLLFEEKTWHKSIRKPRKDGDKTERVWINDIILDSRIAERMRRFEMDPAEEERANRIAAGQEQTRARKMDDLRSEKVVIEKFD